LTPITWTQNYDPFGHWWLSTLVAALPIVVLLGLLAGFKVKAHLCAIAGAATAVLCAIFVFHMPARLALMSFFYGGAFGSVSVARLLFAHDALATEAVGGLVLVALVGAAAAWRRERPREDREGRR